MGKLKRARRVVGIFAAIALLAVTIAPRAGAVDYTGDDQFFNGNDIFMYCRPETANCAETVCGSSDDQAVDLDASTDASAVKKQIFDLLIGGGMNAVQAAAVMGNMRQESNFNPDVHEVGNDIGYGLAQWSFGRRTALEAYARSEGQPVSSVGLQIKYLLKEYNDTYKARLAGTAFATGSVVKDATRAWMMAFEVPAMQPPTDPARLNSVRIPAANQIYKLYSADAPAATADDSTAALQPDCDADAQNGVDGSTAVQGDIVKTALGFAWPNPVANGKSTKADARPSYQVAKQKYDPEGGWSDCGVFVSTVMQASGNDPNWPHVGVHLMGPYVRAHPDKYKIIEHAQTSDMQPGDILIEYSFDHIEISLGGVKSVDASNLQRVPSVRPTGGQYMAGAGSFIARYIGGTSNT